MVMDDAPYRKILKDGNIHLSVNAGMAGLKIIIRQRMSGAVSLQRSSYREKHNYGCQ